MRYFGILAPKQPTTKPFQTFSLPEGMQRYSLAKQMDYKDDFVFALCRTCPLYLHKLDEFNAGSSKQYVCTGMSSSNGEVIMHRKTVALNAAKAHCINRQGGAAPVVPQEMFRPYIEEFPTTT